MNTLPHTYRSCLALVRKHWVACILAIAIGCLTVAPYVYFQHAMPQYAGIKLLGQDAEEYYIARINEVYAGYPLVGNVYLPDKNVPPNTPAFGEDIVASIGEVLRLSAPSVSLFVKFLFPLLAVLLVYTLGFQMTRSRATAVLAATFSILGTDVMSYPGQFLLFLRGINVSDGIYWSRPINPELSGLFLFGISLLIYRAYCEKEEHPSWWYPCSIGILTGLSLYVSIFIWSFLGALLFALLCFALWQREFFKAKSIFLAGALAALGAIPFLINYLQERTYPGFLNTEMQLGLIHSHAPIVGIWVVLLLLVPLFLWPKQFSGARLFLAASALSLLVLINQQVLTGLDLQPTHYHWYITKPLVGIMLAVLAVWLAERFVRSPLVRTAGYTVIIALLLAFSFFAQTNFYYLNSPAAVAAQAYAPVFTYLNAIPSHEVIFTNEVLADYVAMYTHDDAPNDVYAGGYIAPLDYFNEVLFLQYRLQGVTPKDVLPTLDENRGYVSGLLYGYYWEEESGSANAIPESILQSLAQQYTTDYSESIPQMMQGLGVTMILQDRTTDEWPALASTPGLVLMQTIGGRFDVYVPNGKN